MVGEDFQQIRGRMNRLRELTRKNGVVFEWVWHVEPNPAGTGAHVHAWLRTEACLDQGLLSVPAQRAGMGTELDVSLTRTPMGYDGSELRGADTASYSMKTAMGDKQSDRLSDDQKVYLGLNGGRLSHASRGFWVDEHGVRIGGLRKASCRALELQVRAWNTTR